MHHDKLLGQIYDAVNAGKVEDAVMGCVRVARGTRDYFNAAIFLRELYSNKTEVMRVLYKDTSHLTKEAQKFLWDTSLKYWLDVHTLGFGPASDDTDDDRNVLSICAGEIDPELDQWERTIAEMVLPTNLDPFDAAAFSDRNTRERAQIRLRIKALQTIKARLKARCLNYAIQMESQLDLQREGQGFLEAVQNEVNNYFKARSEDVYIKLRKAAQLATSPDHEDSALLLTEVRRALDAAADYFYPPVSHLVRCSDGVNRPLGNEQSLNRLQEFIVANLPDSSARELLEAELDHLVSFMRRLQKVASKGVHSSVTVAEAKQGLVGIYFFLFNICQHLSTKPDIAEAT